MLKYRLEDIVDIISEREENPSNCKYDKFVGLEHYVSGEIEIKNYGNTNLLKSAMKVFNSGDILIARRNVYLKRASVVNFDGITSGDSIVLRAKDELLKRLLPFVLNTDNFWEYAEKFSDGTMSKRLSPKILLKYEFNLPDIKDQEKLAELLWAANDTKAAYKKLLNLTDELVKAQFFEMFGDPIINSKQIKETEFVNVVKLQRGFDLPVKERNETGNIPVYGSNGILGMHDESRVKGGIITGRSGTIGQVHYTFDEFWPLNTTLFSIDLHDNNIIYLAYLLRYFRLERFFNGTGVPTLNRNDVHREKVIDVPVELQSQFAGYVQQVDKAKIELQQTISNLENTMKSLMQQHIK